jgi:type IV pilus assembly protein PilC
MIAAGEKAGKVEDMLDSVADAYDEDVEVMLGTLTSLMEPFLMVFLGVVIGTIVLAMFMPIFNLGSIAH